jgi:arginyl-tRNA synthetase
MNIQQTIMWRILSLRIFEQKFTKPGFINFSIKQEKLINDILIDIVNVKQENLNEIKEKQSVLLI